MQRKGLSRWLQFGAALLLSLSCAAHAFAGPDPDPPPPPPPDDTEEVTDPTIVPPPDPVGGVDDKSYNTLPPEGIGLRIDALREEICKAEGERELFRLRKDVRDLELSICKYLPPKSLMTYSLMGRIGEDFSFGAPAVAYSDNLLGYDLAAQGFFGGVSGFSLRGKHDFTRQRYALAKTLRELNEECVRERTFLSSLKEDAAPLTRGGLLERLDKIQVAADERLCILINRFLTNAYAFRTAIVASHTRIFDSGSLTTAGLAASYLYPLGNYDRCDEAEEGDSAPWGVAAAVSLQGGWSEIDRQPGRSLTRWGVAVAFQDRVPSVYQETRTCKVDGIEYTFKYKKVSRWTWRVGGEYTDQTVLPTEKAVDVFVTYRDQPKQNEPSLANLYRRFTDYTLFVGRGMSGQAFTAFRMSKSY